jgi:hypothetical protein
VARVKITRTKRWRAFINPPEIQCDRCGQFWRDQGRE